MSHLSCPSMREARIKTEANNVPKRTKVPLETVAKVNSLTILLARLS